MWQQLQDLPSAVSETPTAESAGASTPDVAPTPAEPASEAVTVPRLARPRSPRGQGRLALLLGPLALLLGVGAVVYLLSLPEETGRDRVGQQPARARRDASRPTTVADVGKVAADGAVVAEVRGDGARDAGAREDGRRRQGRGAAARRRRDRRPGRLYLNCRPWAEVWIDGAYRGTTPIEGLRLAPGLHRVRVFSRRKKKRRSLRIRIPSGGVVRRVIEL